MSKVLSFDSFQKFSIQNPLITSDIVMFCLCVLICLSAG